MSPMTGEAIMAIIWSTLRPTEAVYIAVSFSVMGLLAGLLARGSFGLRDSLTWLVFGAYVLCVLFEQFGDSDIDRLRP